MSQAAATQQPGLDLETEPLRSTRARRRGFTDVRPLLQAVGFLGEPAADPDAHARSVSDHDMPWPLSNFEMPVVEDDDGSDGDGDCDDGDCDDGADGADFPKQRRRRGGLTDVRTTLDPAMFTDLVPNNPDHLHGDAGPRERDQRRGGTLSRGLGRGASTLPTLRET